MNESCLYDKMIEIVHIYICAVFFFSFNMFLTDYSYDIAIVFKIFFDMGPCFCCLKLSLRMFFVLFANE